jgi:hypothetical protein
MRKIILALALLFYGCKNCPVLPNNTLPFKEINLDICYFKQLAQNEYVFENEAEFSIINKLGSCKEPLPNVDFTKKTLIGKIIKGQCKLEIKKSFQIDDLNQTYTYFLSVCEKGNCKSQVISTNWIIVDKLKAGYQLKFKVEQFN